jgi:hypothetical protein
MTTPTSSQNDPDRLAYCAHSGCACKVEPGQIYCSTDCEEQSDDETCYCGHADCMPEAKEEDL